jgi:methylaspartate mutase epsilon subunit
MTPTSRTLVDPETNWESFGGFVGRMRKARRLVVQPRMGVSDPQQMRRGLLATKHAEATTVGTITLDSYTRVGDHVAARRALRTGGMLNGYPLVAHKLATTRDMLDGVRDATFPVQVRHGSAGPKDIFAALVASGLDATEGGPISYCLPYSRRPLRDSVSEWAQSCELFARLRESGLDPHLETFGGCMLGQLCPPSLLVAISVLEALFFRSHGLDSISLSYAQQTNQDQDTEALRAVRRLATEFLPDADWHLVLYAYMGVYPKTPEGALLLLSEAAHLAVRGGAARLIVKTTAEAHRIPTIEENVVALEAAASTASEDPTRLDDTGPAADTGVYLEALTIIEAVLDLHPRLDNALVIAFQRGLLDVPYCLHPDNAGATRSYIDAEGRLRWSAIGALPIADVVQSQPAPAMTEAGLLSSLSFVSRKFDAGVIDKPVTRTIDSWSAHED